MHHGEWRVTNWPITGRGATARAAWVDYSLKHFYALRRLPPQGMHNGAQQGQSGPASVV